jgi:hypothetical protein
MQDILKNHPEVETEELDTAWREFLRYQRLELTQLLADRGITEEVFNDLASRIDNQLASSKIGWDSTDDIDNDLWQLRTPQAEPQTDPDVATSNFK